MDSRFSVRLKVTIIANVSWGEIRPSTHVFKTSEIYAKIYGLPPVLCSKFSLEEVSGSILRVINSYDNR